MIGFIATLGLISVLALTFVPGKLILILDEHYMFAQNYSTIAAGLTVILILKILIVRFFRKFILGPGIWYERYRKKKIQFAQKEAVRDYIRIITQATKGKVKYLKHSKYLSDNPLFWLNLLSLNDKEMQSTALSQLKRYDFGIFFENYYEIDHVIKIENYNQALTTLENMPEFIQETPWYLEKMIKISLGKNNINQAKDYCKMISRKTNRSELEAEILLKEISMIKDKDKQLKLLSSSYNFSKDNAELNELYLESLYQKGSIEKALEIIAKDWAEIENVNIKKLLHKLLSDSRCQKDKIIFIKNLASKNSSSALLQLLLAELAMEMRMWFVARNALLSITNKMPKESYLLLSKLELLEHNNKEASIKWLEKCINL